MARSLLPRPERSWLQAARSNRGLWPWVLGILALEFLLAYELPTWDLGGHALLNGAVDALARVAPVIHNFDKAAPHPAGLALYFALGVLFMVPKAALFHLWLNSSGAAMYRHFVISPLTTTTPSSPQDFIEQPIRDRPGNERPRSLASRIFWSLAIVLFTVVGLIFMLQLGWEIKADFKGDDRRLELAQLAGGGFGLWLKWSLSWTGWGALLLAVLVNVIRDCVLFARTFLTKGLPERRDQRRGD